MKKISLYFPYFFIVYFLQLFSCSETESSSSNIISTLPENNLNSTSTASEILSFNLSEIIFLEKNRDAIEKKVQEITASIEAIGFKDTAVIHSISDSSKLGGEIGWIDQNQISKKIFLSIKDLEIGEFSNPIIKKTLL